MDIFASCLEYLHPPRLWAGKLDLLQVFGYYQYQDLKVSTSKRFTGTHTTPVF